MKIDKRDVSLVSSLVKMGAIHINTEDPFTLKDGTTSPMYINLRLLQSVPQVLHRVAERMIRVAREQVYCTDLVSGIPTAGVPLGIAFSLASEIPHVTARMEKKDHGLPATVDGMYEKGDRVLVIDDVVSGAQSKVEYMRALRRAGLKPAGVVVVLDRQRGGVATLRRQQIEVASVLTMQTLLSAMREITYISPETYIQLLGMLRLEDDEGLKNTAAPAQARSTPSSRRSRRK